MHKKIVSLILIVLIAAGLGTWLLLTNEDDTTDNPEQTITEDEVVETNDNETQQQSLQNEIKLPESDFLNEYTIEGTEFGTVTTVTLSDDTRTIITNALPNHETGEFPNDGNPNAISAQNRTYSITLNPVKSSEPTFAREPGVAISGVKFEPQTAERVVCTSGESFSVEAIQDLANLGLDTQNAHVQPTGEYHYHAVSQGLVDSADSGEDLLHVGFALDGYMMYYSKSGAFKPSMELSSTPRTGSGCTFTFARSTTDITIDGTTPDGTYVSDWEYVAGSGDLDECNGTTIDGQYVYLVTDEYPYLPRCLNGEFTQTGPGAGGPLPV